MNAFVLKKTFKQIISRAYIHSNHLTVPCICAKHQLNKEKNLSYLTGTEWKPKLLFFNIHVGGWGAGGISNNTEYLRFQSHISTTNIHFLKIKGISMTYSFLNMVVTYCPL